MCCLGDSFILGARHYRFFLGILSAQYMALSINLIKEHFSDDYWKPFGAVYSAMRILGILLAYIIG